MGEHELDQIGTYGSAEQDPDRRAAPAAPEDVLVERLLDNAATASQERQLLRDDNDDETALREAVRLNVAMPLLTRNRALEGAIEELANRLTPLYLQVDTLAERPCDNEPYFTFALNIAADLRDIQAALRRYMIDTKESESSIPQLQAEGETK